MKLKKRIFSFLAVLAVSGLAILMCTACMSAEEKEKAKEDLRPFFRKTYGDGAPDFQREQIPTGTLTNSFMSLFFCLKFRSSAKPPFIVQHSFVILDRCARPAALPGTAAVRGDTPCFL